MERKTLKTNGWFLRAKKNCQSKDPPVEAGIKLVFSGNERYTVGEDFDLIPAFFLAFKKALDGYHPSITRLSLINYWIKSNGAANSTLISVRVKILDSNTKKKWESKGCSSTLLEAIIQTFENVFNEILSDL